MSNLILNNPRLAFWIIAAFFFLVSAIPWGILFSFLGYKVRMNREANETIQMRKDNAEMKEKIVRLESENEKNRAKIKGARMALA